MFTLLCKWLVSIFTADKIGILVRQLLIKSTTSVAKEILDVRNQKKAYEFVKELNARTDLTGKEKQNEFNQKMLDWASNLGIILKDSAINCLRELAVSAVKVETEEGKDK